MSNLLFATAGAKFYIGAAKSYNYADFVEADFNGVAFTEIMGVTDMGTIGDKSELITSNWIGVARTVKAKGGRDSGSIQIVADLNYADPGQAALFAAEKAAGTYAFKIVFNDAPSGGTPSVRYFTALVMTVTEALAQSNNVMALNATLEIDSNVVRVSAAA
jgi:hypothetical protein